MYIVRTEHDLPALRIMMGSGGGTRSEAIFQCVRGRGEPSEVARCGTSELGLPSTLTDLQRLDEASFAVPPHVITALDAAVHKLGPSPLAPENALWLELPSPRGYLYLVPWERLLTPLGRPLLRVPNHTLRPTASTTSLQVAVCASAPQAKSVFDTVAVLEQLSVVWHSNAGRSVTIHAFTDVTGAERLRGRVSSLGLPVVVHDPRQADSYAAPQRTGDIGQSTLVSNPWLLWIRDAMEGQALDVVHFASHGYLSGDRGAIALASTPTRNTDREMSRFVGAAELSTFFSQVGAWSLVLTGPPFNYSPAGLRELADAIAQAHPSVAAVHDLGLDAAMSEFAGTVGTILCSGPPITDPTPAITCWVHPRLVQFPQEEQEELHLTEQGNSSFISDATQAALARDDTPAWIAAATRNVEALQANWLPDNPDESADPDAMAAIKSVASLVEKHASRSYGTAKRTQAGPS